EDFAITSLVSPAGRNWIRAVGPDTVVISNGVAHDFGTRAGGFTFVRVLTRNDGRRLQLDAVFRLDPQNLIVTRHIAVVSGSPTFETWTSFRALTDPVPLANLNAWQSVVAPGAMHWLTGHQPAQGDTTLDTTFARRQQTLTAGQTLTFGSTARSSEQTVPWM